MTFRARWDELVFERNGARKGTVIGGEFRSNTKSKPRIFINQSVSSQTRNVPPGSREFPCSLTFLL